MLPLLLVLSGAAALVAGWWLLRGLGPKARIGRILAATHVVEVGRAIELAEAGRPRYVGVGGRIDADAPWEDESGRPLVFRRSSLERREGSQWVAFEEDRRAVPFQVSGALDHIAVDPDAVGDGLVVVTRESEGTAADVPDRVPAGTPPTTSVRLRVEFLSAVDHALVLGVPTATADGPVMTAGLGRPLIVTTLEPAEAMRLLAEGRQGTTRAITALLLGGGLVVLVGLGWAAADALL
ncbi:MAG TPA: hypothetical protein VGK16_10215 [Candidatus Limnocylindrales bacterium]